MSARIQWIQYNELVLGENAPNDEPDNDNRPLKQICLYSNLNPQAEDFPGFVGCYQGNGSPEGVQTGNIRNGFWSVDQGTYWMKQTGDNTNTGWIKIGGVGGDHEIGDGDPNGVITADHVGKYYDQLDSAGEHPTWVKRDIAVVTPLSREYFNGAGDIAARTADGGGDVAKAVGTWAENGGATGGLITISSSKATTTFTGVSCYNLTGVTGLTTEQSIDLVVEKLVGVPVSNLVGVGARFSTSALSGFLVTLNLFSGSLAIQKSVAGVLTSLTSVVIDAYANADPFVARVGIRCYDVGLSTTIEAWANGKKYLTTTDATYFGTIGTPALWFSTAGAFTGLIAVPDFTVGSIVSSDTDTGWYSQNGFESNRNISIGTNSVAGDYDYDASEDTGSIAIGYEAVATNPSDSGYSYGNVAIGTRAFAVGDGTVSIGDVSVALGSGSTAVGVAAKAGSELSTAFGFSASAAALEGTALGQSANCNGEGGVAVGSSAFNSALEGVAIGKTATIDSISTWGIAVGSDTVLDNSDHAVAIGWESAAHFGESAVCVGYECIIDKARYGIAIGCQATVDNITDSNPNTVASGIAIGTQATVNAIEGIAIGGFARVYSTGSEAIAIGGGATARALYSISIGYLVNVAVGFNGAIGLNSSPAKANQLAIGDTTSDSHISEVRVGKGDSSTTAVAVTFRVTDGAGSNGVGADFVVQAGRGTGTGTPGAFIVKTSPTTGSGFTLQTATERFRVGSAGVTVTGTLAVTGGVTGAKTTVTYSASMTPDSSLGDIQEITATNGTAFTINAPTNPTTGQQLIVVIRNTSGGALGVATFNAVFKMTAWTQPATGFSRSIRFYYNGTNWVEINRTAADVPN